MLGDPVNLVDPEGRTPILLLFLFGIGLSEYVNAPAVGDTIYDGPTDAAYLLPLAPFNKGGAGFCKLKKIPDETLRFDPSGRWKNNGKWQRGPHLHFDPFKNSKELMKWHLPYQ